MLVIAVLLAVAPAAHANVFEASRASGSFAFTSAERGEASLTIGFIAAHARITGPLALQRSIACVGGGLLRSCAKLTRKTSGITVLVLRPIAVMLARTGSYTVRITGASRIRGVFISGCGTVRLQGTGAFRADDGQDVSYTQADPAAVIHLKP